MSESSTTPHEHPYYLTYSDPSLRWKWRLSLIALTLLTLGMATAAALLIHLLAHTF